MAGSGVLFASIAAVAFGLWTVFHQQASGKIDYLLGAILVSLTAVVIGSLFLLPRLFTSDIAVSKLGLLFVVFAGASALALDFFVLKAYASGLPITIGGPIVIGGSIAVASAIGLFLGESFSVLKIGAIALVLIGAGVLASLGK